MPNYYKILIFCICLETRTQELFLANEQLKEKYIEQKQSEKLLNTR